MNIVAESGVDRYAATPLSNAFTEPRYRDGIIYTYVESQSIVLTPSFLPVGTIPKCLVSC